MVWAGCVDEPMGARGQDDGVILEIVQVYSPGDLLVGMTNQRATAVTVAEQGFRLISGSGTAVEPVSSDHGRPFPDEQRLGPGQALEAYLEFPWRTDPPYVLRYDFGGVTIDVFVDWPALESLTPTTETDYESGF